jgi:hypothetical protein
MMDTYPYVQSPGRLVGFLKQLRTIGKPARFTIDTLRALGYTSSNDRGFLRVLRFLGLIGPSGEPTPRWEAMRARFEVAIADAIRTSYADVFSQYPDAPRRDDEALRAFFGAKTSVGGAAVAKMAATFRALCSILNFSEEETKQPTTETGVGTPVGPPSISRSEGDAGCHVIINIALSLPADPSGEAYERVFEVIGRHLLGRKAF